MVMQDATKRTTTTVPAEAVTDETILKIAKEIAVKFIEVGRITPATFAAAFPGIYATIDQTVRKNKL